MATCGKCKSTNVDVEHVKACYSASTPVAPPAPAAADFRPMAVTSIVPDSKYALENDEGVFLFYEVKTGKGRWSNFTFVDRLVGAPGDWQRYPVKGDAKFKVLANIQLDSKAAAAAFSREHGVCACCGSPLSDPFSIANGLGPICIRRFAA